MKTSELDYILRDELIAQEPVEPRDSSRLMVVDRALGAVSHSRFSEIGVHLRPGDLLVFNDSKVFKARLRGEIKGAPAELFLASEEAPGLWKALVRPGRKVSSGEVVVLSGGLRGTFEAKGADGVCLVRFNLSASEIFDYCDKNGQVPLPPYVAENPAHEARYQTVYADKRGSVAAPTAGLHFTSELLASLQGQGVGSAFVTLHVGLGTFQPIRVSELDKHVMHAESYVLSALTIQKIRETKQNGCRVIPVGTTALRTLEANAHQILGADVPRETAGSTSIFISPGYEFKVADALITNFHLPQSTLLALVYAFGGTELMRRAYAEAIAEKYRFYSFGDAMLIE